MDQKQIEKEILELKKILSPAVLKNIQSRKIFTKNVQQKKEKKSYLPGYRKKFLENPIEEEKEQQKQIGDPFNEIMFDE